MQWGGARTDMRGGEPDGQRGWGVKAGLWVMVPSPPRPCSAPPEKGRETRVAVFMGYISLLLHLWSPLSKKGGCQSCSLRCSSYSETKS